MTLSLAGSWTLIDEASHEVGPIAIPGDVHSALIAAGRIPDPMIGKNEAEMQWVGDAVWEVRRRFAVAASEIEGKWAVLDLEFVDTFASVFVNGVNVGEVDSSFRRYRFDVTKALRRATTTSHYASARRPPKRMRARRGSPSRSRGVLATTASPTST